MSKIKKILFPIGSFYPTTFGGPGTILYWQGVYLKKNSVAPTFVTTTEGITNPISVNQFIDLPCGSVYYGQGGVLNMKTINIMLKEVAKTDIIHLTSLFSPISIICFFYAFLFYSHKKIVWSVRGELNKNALAISKTKKKWLLKLYKVTTKKVVFASTSPKETQEIKAFFKNKIIEIPNVMPSSKKMGRTTEDKRFLFLGRIHPIKNIDGLIKAVAQSELFKSEKVYLDIAGDYDDRDIEYLNNLKELVENYNLNSKITFLGHVAGEDKEQLLANAYFLILPSHTENFGNVVIESLNQGTPVIASKNTPWKELEDFNSGYWIENSPSKIAESIDDALILNKEAYLNMRQSALTLVNEKYSIQTRIQDWVNTYKKILQ